MTPPPHSDNLTNNYDQNMIIFIVKDNYDPLPIEISMVFGLSYDVVK